MSPKEKLSLDKAKQLIKHIDEQITKRQYWNALATSNELSLSIMRLFDCVLKNDK